MYPPTTEGRKTQILHYEQEMEAERAYFGGMPRIFIRKEIRRLATKLLKEKSEKGLTEEEESARHLRSSGLILGLSL